MTKKLIFLLFIILMFSFSFSEELNANYKAISVNLFYDMYEYTQENLDKSLTDAYKQVGKEYGITAYAIKKIVNGDTFYCFRFFDKLGIKPDKDGNYKLEDFVACRDKVQSLVNNFLYSDIIKKSVDDSLKGENFFADGDEENSSYDLLIDFKNLTEILFKEEIILNTKFDLLAGNGFGGGNEGNISNMNYPTNGNNNGNELSLNNGNNNGDNIDSNLINNVLEQIDGNNTFTQQNNLNSFGDNNGKNTNSLLSNIPIGSNCGGGNTSNNTYNSNGIGQQNLSGNDSLNNPNFSLGGGNNLTNQNNLVNPEENYDNYLFPIDEGEIPVGLEDVGLSGSNLASDSTNNGKGTGGGGGSSCPSDDLLSICIKLVPSGPRGPVGGTTKKRSIEEVIDKISDTLKYMRQTWIVVAGHGDEALDIDFKHVSLPDIFAFNIILTPKPVFNFKQDKDVKKQVNAPDTELENVPRKLAKIYSDLNIVDGFNSRADFRKYLITDFDKIKPYRRVNLNYPEKITNDSASGIFDEADKYSALLTNILNMLNSMEELTRNWIGSSIALEEKSTW